MVTDISKQSRLFNSWLVSYTSQSCWQSMSLQNALECHFWTSFLCHTLWWIIKHLQDKHTSSEWQMSEEERKPNISVTKSGSCSKMESIFMVVITTSINYINYFSMMLGIVNHHIRYAVQRIVFTNESYSQIKVQLLIHQKKELQLCMESHHS